MVPAAPITPTPTGRKAGASLTTSRPPLREDLPLLVQHLDELRQAAGPGLGAFRVLQTVEDGEAVGAVQGAEESLRLRVLVERRLEVVRHGGGALGGVGGIPAPVRSGSL